MTHHLIMHAALDQIQEQQYLTQNMYLRRLESSQKLGTYAYITASNARFLIQFEDNEWSEESIKKFFTTVQDLYVKV